MINKVKYLQILNQQQPQFLVIKKIVFQVVPKMELIIYKVIEIKMYRLLMNILKPIIKNFIIITSILIIIIFLQIYLQIFLQIAIKK